MKKRNFIPNAKPNKNISSQKVNIKKSTPTTKVDNNKIETPKDNNNQYQSYYTCVNCTSIPLFRIYVHDNKFDISLQCNCKGIKFPYFTSYSNITKRSKTLIHKCTKHNDKSVLYCVTCKTCLCQKCSDIHSKTGRNHFKTNNELSFSYMCDKHNKEKILYLCKNCKTNLCEKCLTKHNTDFKAHLLYTKENDIITGRVNEIIKQCKSLIKYNEILKNKITNLLAGNNERIKQIEEQYNINLKINEEIIHFIEIMLENYKELPYILYNHFHFFHLLQIQYMKFSDNIRENEINEISLAFIEYLSQYHVIMNEALSFSFKKVISADLSCEITQLTKTHYLLWGEYEYKYQIIDITNPPEHISESSFNKDDYQDYLTYIQRLKNDDLIVASTRRLYKYDLDNNFSLIPLKEFDSFKKIVGIFQNPFDDNILIIFSVNTINHYSLKTNQFITIEDTNDERIQGYSHSLFNKNEFCLLSHLKLYVKNVLSMKTIRQKDVNYDALEVELCQRGNVIAVIYQFSVEFYDYKTLETLKTIPIKDNHPYSYNGRMRAMNEGIVLCYNYDFLYVIDDFDFSIIKIIPFTEFYIQLVAYSDQELFFSPNLWVFNKYSKKYMISNI